MEHNPRVVFERMFGDGGSTDPKAAAGAHGAEPQHPGLGHREGRRACREALGPRDGTKITEYLDAIRDIERRIQLAEAQSTRDLPAFDEPAGVPATFEEHARLMFDLQVLAYQSDMTRVITFMMGREFSSRTYPEIGAPGGHHPLSHESSASSQDQLLRINVHHAQQFAYYLRKLQATPDGDGSLLDHLSLYYGAGMSNGNHIPENLPMVLLGDLGVAGGRHIKYDSTTPLANLHTDCAASARTATSSGCTTPRARWTCRRPRPPSGPDDEGQGTVTVRVAFGGVGRRVRRCRHRRHGPARRTFGLSRRSRAVTAAASTPR